VVVDSNRVIQEAEIEETNPNEEERVDKI